MKNFLIVNMSPRVKGTSALIAGMCAERLTARGAHVARMNLYPELKHPETLIEAVKSADVLIFSGPSYINTYPADVTAFLMILAARPDALHGQSLYGIIQGGMPYAHTHECGLNMLEIFAEKVGLKYQGGFVLGMGAMVDGGPFERLLNAKKARRQLNLFFDHMERDEPSPRDVYLYAQMTMPSIAARVMARIANHSIDAQQRKLAATGAIKLDH